MHRLSGISIRLIEKRKHEKSLSLDSLEIEFDLCLIENTVGQIFENFRSGDELTHKDYTFMITSFWLHSSEKEIARLCISVYRATPEADLWRLVELIVRYCEINKESYEVTRNISPQSAALEFQISIPIVCNPFPSDFSELDSILNTSGISMPEDDNDDED